MSNIQPLNYSMNENSESKVLSNTSETRYSGFSFAPPHSHLSNAVRATIKKRYIEKLIKTKED